MRITLLTNPVGNRHDVLHHWVVVRNEATTARQLALHPEWTIRRTAWEIMRLHPLLLQTSSREEVSEAVALTWRGERVAQHLLLGDVAITGAPLCVLCPDSLRAEPLPLPIAAAAADVRPPPDLKPAAVPIPSKRKVAAPRRRTTATTGGGWVRDESPKGKSAARKRKLRASS